VSTTALKLISSMATREILAELATQYAHTFSQPITAEAAGGVDVAKRVQLGEAVDIVVLANNAINQLITAGKLLAGSLVAKGDSEPLRLVGITLSAVFSLLYALLFLPALLLGYRGRT